MALIPIIPAVLIKLISKMTGSEIKAKIIGYAMIAQDQNLEKKRKKLDLNNHYLLYLK